MTTMSEIVLVVCLVREQLLQYMVAIIQYASEEIVIAVGGIASSVGVGSLAIGKDQASLLAEQKLQCVFFGFAAFCVFSRNLAAIFCIQRNLAEFSVVRVNSANPNINRKYY